MVPFDPSPPEALPPVDESEAPPQPTTVMAAAVIAARAKVGILMRPSQLLVERVSYLRGREYSAGIYNKAGRKYHHYRLSGVWTLPGERRSPPCGRASACGW
jgi:hypothetical protein